MAPEATPQNEDPKELKPHTLTPESITAHKNKKTTKNIAKSMRVTRVNSQSKEEGKDQEYHT